MERRKDGAGGASTSPGVTGWNTPSLLISAYTYGNGSVVTFRRDAADSAGETRPFSRSVQFIADGGPPDA